MMASSRENILHEMLKLQGSFIAERLAVVIVSVAVIFHSHFNPNLFVTYQALLQMGSRRSTFADSVSSEIH
jgi:hypothetical protein